MSIEAFSGLRRPSPSSFGAPAGEAAHMSLAYTRFRRQIAALMGVALCPDRRHVLESRLGPTLRAHDISDLQELTRALDAGGNETLLQDVIDAVVNNETSFFRDRAPFDEFHERVLPKLLAARAKARHLRIWCAAASTGQEAYSLAMILDHEARALRGWTVEILGTDISRTAIDIARNGVYSHFEVQRGLPINHLLRYFHRHEEGWRVNEHLRATVAFREFNLLSDPSALGTFDAIFCGNVLALLEPGARRDVLARLNAALATDGFLFLGAAESLGEAGPAYVPISNHGVRRLRANQRPNLVLA
jgi:chemotaxis protein methyltransferase CheR